MSRCRVGLLSDIQYADIPNGQNYHRTRTRFYRGGVQHVEKALADWGAISAQPSVDLILDLGDHLDGYCARLGHRDAALAKLGAVFRPVRVPVHHVVGNHELYNFRRHELFETFLFREARHLIPSRAAADDLCYYSVTPVEGFRIVLLDAYDVSVLGRDEKDERFLAAYRELVSHNANDDLNNHRDVDQPEFVAFNGGIGEAQTEWLEAELEEARRRRQIVIVLCHVPIHPSSTDFPESKLWNWSSVNALLNRHSDVVKLVLVGHTHMWKQGVSEAGIVHCSLPGLIETAPDQSGVGILELDSQEIRLLGNGGLIPDLTIDLTHGEKIHH